MFFRILGRELKRKKGINFILFLFVILATIFVAASVNNILVVMNATDYCIEKGNVPDDSIWSYEENSVKSIDNWLDNEGKKYYQSYTANTAVALAQTNIKSFKNEEGSDYKITNSIIIQSTWDYMTAYDYDYNEISMNDGELSMKKQDMELNNLEAGDKITIEVNGYERTFTVTEPIYDPAYGGDFIGETRYFVSENEYEKIKEASGNYVTIYNIITDDVDEFSVRINRLGVNITVEITKDLYAFTYIMSVISAGIITIVGACLIVIAFLILRFTISVTLTEDYREIGIMKAIGLKDFAIRKIYLVKYLALSLVGIIIGAVVSIPVSTGMLSVVASNMMMQNGAAHKEINILCAVLVLIIIMMFCYFSTGKLKKFSAIDAIRDGSKGERFAKSPLRLFRKKKMRVPFFMAINDIVSSTKKYIAMILTFAIGIVLVILCCNTITTFRSSEMAKSFLLDTDCEAYINADTIYDRSQFDMTGKAVKEYVEKVKNELSDKGHEADIHTIIFFSSSVYVDKDAEDMRSFMAIQPVNNDGKYIPLTKGSIPELDNEVVISKQVSDKLGVNIGDSIHMQLGEVDYKMIVCGIYENYMQMGQTILLSESFNSDELVTKGSWYYQIDLKNADDSFESLKNDMPQYEIMNSYGVMENNIGSIMSKIGVIKVAVLILIGAVNVLITVLMLKMFIMEENGQIAMLRSVGFSVYAVRLHQIIRMGIVFVIGAVIGIIISIPLNTLALKPIFGLMGATNLKIQVVPVETYLLYPAVLAVVVIVSTIAASATIKKMNLMEINNIE